MRFLIFVSLFCALFAACSSSKRLVTKDIATIPFWTTELLDSTTKNDFRLTLSTPKATITGIYIVKQMDGAWKGTLVNEFGLKVFDFVSTPKECKLLNVIYFIDKWYIKKTVAADIQFIMEVDNPAYNIGVQSNRHFVQDTLVVTYKKEKELRRLPDGEIIYKNHKHDIKYSLIRI